MTLTAEQTLARSMSEADTSPAVSTATPRRHRHSWWLRNVDVNVTPDGGPGVVIGADPTVRCIVCGKAKDPVTSRRGRTSLRAGKDAEREVARRAGPEWRRIGQFGTPVDVEAPWAVGQVKAGMRYSLVDQRDLDGMAAYAGGRVRLLFKVSRPGPGNARRVQVTMRLSQFIEEFGDALVALDMPDWSAMKRGDR